MAICNLNRNLLKSIACGYSLPEVVNIYLVNYDDISGTTVTEGSGTTLGCDEIATIGLKASANVYQVEPQKNSASFEDTLVVTDNGRKYRTASITFTVPVSNFDACMHGALDALSLGRYFAVVQTADGDYIGFGRLRPLEAETASLAGGSDSDGMQVVLTGNIAESPLPLSEAAVTALLAAVAA